MTKTIALEREPHWRSAGISKAIPGRRTRKVAQRRTLPRKERLLISVIGIVGVLALWQLASTTGRVDSTITSSPSEIARTAVDMIRSGKLQSALGSSAKLFVTGFGIALALGLATGIVLGWYKRIEALVDPWVSILYASPRVALIPVFMVWTGIGFKTQVVIVVTIAAFPIIINTSAGVSSIDRNHLQLARSFLATNRDVLFTIALPGSIPLILAGVRQGLMQGLIGVVVAEYFVGATGVGGLIFNAGQVLDTAQAFVGAALFAVAAMILSSLVKLIERRLDRWRA